MAAARQEGDAALARHTKVWRVRVFAATWLSYAGFYFTRKPFSIVKKDLGDANAWDAEVLGYLGAVYLVAYTVGQFVGGAAGSRWGPRYVLLVGTLLTMGANAAFGVTNNLGMFALLMALNGLAQATGWSNNVGTMGRWFRREERGKVMGVWATNYQVGGVLANTLAAWILGTTFGFRYAFFAGSVVLLGVLIFYVFNQRDRPEDVGLPPVVSEEEEEGGGGSGGASEGARGVVFNIILIGMFYFFVKFIRYSLWSWAPYLLQTRYGLEGDEAGYISTIFDVAGVAGVIACGYVSDRLFKGRRTTTALLFIGGMALSCVCLYVLGQQTVALFAASMGLIGFTLYGPDALMTGAAAIDVGSAKRAVLAAGVINGMGSVGSIVQELLLGRLLKGGEVGLVFGLLLGSAVLAGASLGVLWLRNRLGAADV